MAASADRIERRLRTYTGSESSAEFKEIGYLLDICSYGFVSRKSQVQFTSKFGEHTISGAPFYSTEQERNCPEEVYDRLVRLWIERGIERSIDLNIQVPFGSRGRSFGRQVLEAVFFPLLNQRYASLQTLSFRSELRLSRNESAIMAEGIARAGVRRLTFVECGKLWSDVFKGVEHNKTLSELIVINTGIADPQNLFHFLSRSSSLRTLKLINATFLPPVSFMPLLHSYDLHLTTLDLSMSQRIAPENLQNLCRALQHQLTLHSLNLSSCGIDDNQLGELSKALVFNDTLQYLQLTTNSITSCDALFLLFSSNRTIISCSLVANPVTSSESFPELAELLAIRKYNLACRRIALLPLLLSRIS